MEEDKEEAMLVLAKVLFSWLGDDYKDNNFVINLRLILFYALIDILKYFILSKTKYDF